MKDQVCAFFSEKVIPLLEQLFGDEWVDRYGFTGGYDFFLRLPKHMEEHINYLRKAATEWFGDAIWGVAQSSNGLLSVRFRPA